MPDKRKRILMIAPTSFFLDYGCHVRILEEVQALLAQGMAVRIVTYYMGRDWPGLDIVRSAPTPWRADYEVGSSRHKIVFDVLLSLRALWEALIWRPHLIHGHLHEGALIGSVLARLLRVPIVFDFQGSMTAEMVDHHFIQPDTRAFYWWRRLEERIVQLPDAVVTSTVHSAEMIARNFSRERDVIPLPDSVNLEFFSPARLSPDARAAQRCALGLPPERQVVVYLGLLADYQGIPQLLHAAAQLRRRGYAVSFLIMGFPAVEHYRQMAVDLGLTREDVIFTGKTRYEDAPSYLALGDVAIAPKISATEGSGKILNYMAMALPTVVYDTPVSREYLGKLGIYAEPVGDATALTRALAFILRNPTAGEQLGLKLRERAERYFSWQRTGLQLRRLYEALWRETTRDGG